ncbi:site-specific tyrosine recombinase XerD [Streptococcus sciuri]|uniref:Site-specific tyrosine recombinase XerD n=1 Tax=Streptococcus sciuri TaxID=2973939 RepID=A0ABT2F8T8_9STRE|nr:site-specific tyrosine recombinase XerD [Streptococcus sciuri]MCS4488834.1 site-specific tyrosine recombinase XerD [Streptococcus sciuri]
MTNLINDFLSQKNLSESSQKNYRYDINQFLQEVNNQLTLDKLRLYEQKLQTKSLAVKKRKQSTLNQFLWFLYQESVIGYAYKFHISSPMNSHQPVKQPNLIDKSLLYTNYADIDGQLIALLIVELGLTPIEIAYLKNEMIDLEFGVIRLEKKNCLRIVTLPKQLVAPLKKKVMKKGYLFSHNGKPYSRQWYFNKLTTYLEGIGLANETAQSLRTQYILNEKASGKTAQQIAQQLGLKSAVTLEKYFNGY